MECEQLTNKLRNLLLPEPFKGIQRFYDISTLLASPLMFREVIDRLSYIVNEQNPDCICCLDSRGFLFAAPIAYKLGKPLVMIRKKGKLPGKCETVTFEKEYEPTDAFEMQMGSIKDFWKVVVVDDILATGGSMKAAFELIRLQGAENVEGVCLLDLELPGSHELLDQHEIRVTSLLRVSDLT